MSDVRIIARRLAIRKSQGESDVELTGNALPPCIDPTEIDGLAHTQYMEDAIRRLARRSKTTPA